MIEIKVGNELDRAVAKAIGLELHDRGHGYARYMNVRQWYWLIGKDFPEEAGCLTNVAFPFDPSEDLNLAFAAAEKAGLFSGNHLRGSEPNNHCAMLYMLSDDLWHVSGCCGERYSDATTPALAICAAILMVKEA
jgi:hypothetical protein